MPSPCWPPLASWANVVITYLLSDFLGLWQAMQFSTRIGATSRIKLTVFIPPPGAGGVGLGAGALAAEASFGLSFPGSAGGFSPFVAGGAGAFGAVFSAWDFASSARAGTTTAVARTEARSVAIRRRA